MDKHCWRNDLEAIIAKDVGENESGEEEVEKTRSKNQKRKGYWLMKTLGHLWRIRTVALRENH